MYDYFFADFNAHQIFADFQRTGICFSGKRDQVCGITGYYV